MTRIEEKVPIFCITCTLSKVVRKYWRVKGMSALTAAKMNFYASIWASTFDTECNEWYPRGLQISLHMRSPGLQDYGEGGGISE